ncbi:hypothetical protein [Pseudomonas vlassakiae]|uniref:Translation initiation factor 2 n=1 Tax=Pseudomonas vlassakiae TaxID=485888 RepID=A0A923K5M8_9PSED|nr:hypothetical protein [Pseudomonas vlassakiae]MBV4543576.1 hypothetical protein [Pseudomonas vlassakiae]
MNLLRSAALFICIAPFYLPCGVVQAAQPAAQVQAGHDKAAGKAPAKPVAKAKPAASKAKAKVKAKSVSKAVTQPLPKARLDLSLPTDMVNNLEPEVGDPATRRKPLLPAMFAEKPESSDSPFQLNGRLISNEMQLQLRNDSRHEVEGAAIDFQFRN